MKGVVSREGLRVNETPAGKWRLGGDSWFEMLCWEHGHGLEQCLWWEAESRGCLFVILRGKTRKYVRILMK